MIDLRWALDELDPGNDRLQAYALYHSYYHGNHRLAFATDKYKTAFWALFSEFADNLCESVVDVTAERLEIVGFSTNKATTDKIQLETGVEIPVVKDQLGDDLWEMWEQEDLDLVSDEVHHSALLYGDGFAIVWDEDLDGPVIWPQFPLNMAVRYSSEFRGRMDCAAKAWREDDGYLRVNVYDELVVAKFRSRRPQDGTSIDSYKPERFTQIDEIEHQAGRVPVFHWPNRAYGGYGISELRAVVPLQDVLNKAICDMIVSMEFTAFQQRWATGVEIETDEFGRPKDVPFEYGADRLWTIPNPDAKVGSFSVGDPEPFLKVQRDMRAEIARVSGVPLHYFFVSTLEAPSGEALKTSELRFSRKLGRKQRLFGKVWENTLAAALSMSGDPLEEDVDVNAVWTTESSRSESEILDAQLKKKEIGVPNSQLQREVGYDPEQIQQFAQEQASKAPDIEPSGPPGGGDEGDDSPAAVERRRRVDEVVPPQSRT